MSINNTVNRIGFGNDARSFAALTLGTSTSEASFSKNSLVIGGSTVVAASPAILQAPSQNGVPMVWDNGRAVFVGHQGTCTTGTTANLTLKLYQVPASVVTTLASGSVSGLNLMATSSARSIASTTANWWFRATLQWNSTSKLLQGTFDTGINDLFDAPAAITAVTTATAFDTELNFILSATLSSGNASNVVTCYDACFQPAF